MYLVCCLQNVVAHHYHLSSCSLSPTGSCAVCSHHATALCSISCHVCCCRSTLSCSSRSWCATYPSSVYHPTTTP